MDIALIGVILFHSLLYVVCLVHWIVSNNFYRSTIKYSIAGGNQEIINILKEKSNKFEECLFTSVKYHRYELTNWLNENYKCKHFPLPRCIWYYNIDAFFYFLEHGHSLDEIERFEKTCLHYAFEFLISYLFASS